MNAKLKVAMGVSNFEAVNTSINIVIIDDVEMLRVVKAKKIDEYDENTYAKVKNLNMKDGIIEVDMKSRLLPDAPDFARGFIGIAFRINEDDSEFESFYIRPANSVNMTNDAVRQSHGCQYFSYTGYTFSYFRENNITGYEAPISNGLDEWIHLKAVIDGRSAKFYLDNEETPTLSVTDLLHGEGITGGIGFFTDIGTEALFKNLVLRNYE